LALVPNLYNSNGNAEAALPSEYRYKAISCGGQLFLIEESQMNAFSEFVNKGEKLDFNSTFFIRENNDFRK
jgi:hypothetical protein